MYSETLLTPNPVRYPEVALGLLHDAAELSRIKDGLDTVQAFGQDVYDSAKLDAAIMIAGHVKTALHFPITNNERDDFVEHRLPFPLPLETVTERQITNCFGFTLVTSECLEEAGIDHWIGFANGHSFLLLPYGNNNVYYLDSLSPEFNQPVDTALERGDGLSIKEQLQMHNRAAVMLDSQKLSINVGLEVDSAARKFPWLVVDKAHNGGQLQSMNERTRMQKYESQYKLILSVFDMHEGRSALENYVALQCSLNTANVERSCMLLKDLSGRFPDLDARQTHEEVKSLATKLCVTDPAAAVELVEDYFINNFALTGDSRIPEAMGDLLRKIARISNNREAAQKAIDAYNETMRRPLAFTAAVIGKLTSAEFLLSEQL